MNQSSKTLQWCLKAKKTIKAKQSKSLLPNQITWLEKACFSLGGRPDQNWQLKLFSPSPPSVLPVSLPTQHTEPELLPNTACDWLGVVMIVTNIKYLQINSQ